MGRVGFIKNACAGWVSQAMIDQGFQIPVTMGLVNDSLRTWIDEDRDFVYLDHSYFKRGWGKNNFRAVRRALHLNYLVQRPDDRLKKFEVEIEPWRKTGTKVVVIPPSFYQEKFGARGWLPATLQKLAQSTDRPVVVKHEKGNLREYLSDAWCVVTWASVAGVEAALMGVPVFAGESCPARPVSAGEDIDKPEYSEIRREWASSLAYASWNADEIDSIEWKDYRYALRHDLSP